jgi:NADH dehydrogenase
VLCPDEKAELAALAARPPDSVAADEPTVEIVRGGMDSSHSINEVMKGAVGLVLMSPVTMSGRMYRPLSHLEDVRRTIEAAENAAIRKFVYHSALGAHPQAVSRAMREALDAEALVSASRCEDYCMRTGPLMGRGDQFMSELNARARTGSPFMGIMGYGSTLVQPLHVQDMARCVTRFFIENPTELPPRIYALAGPEVTTVLDLLDLALENSNRLKFKFHAPLFVLKSLTSVVKDARFQERVALLFDLFYTDINDAPQLLDPGTALRTPKQTQEEIAGSVPAPALVAR